MKHVNYPSFTELCDCPADVALKLAELDGEMVLAVATDGVAVGGFLRFSSADLEAGGMPAKVALLSGTEYVVVPKSVVSILATDESGEVVVRPKAVEPEHRCGCGCNLSHCAVPSTEDRKLAFMRLCFDDAEMGDAFKLYIPGSSPFQWHPDTAEAMENLSEEDTEFLAGMGRWVVDQLTEQEGDGGFISPCPDCIGFAPEGRHHWICGKTEPEVHVPMILVHQPDRTYGVWNYRAPSEPPLVYYSQQEALRLKTADPTVILLGGPSGTLPHSFMCDHDLHKALDAVSALVRLAASVSGTPYGRELLAKWEDVRSTVVTSPLWDVVPFEEV